MSHCDKINKNLDKAVTSIRKKKKPILNKINKIKL